jgi:CubicO group peptidase (beta-lactamase class C family)
MIHGIAAMAVLKNQYMIILSEAGDPRRPSRKITQYIKMQNYLHRFGRCQKFVLIIILLIGLCSNLKSQTNSPSIPQLISRASAINSSGLDREQAVRELGELRSKDTTVIVFLVDCLSDVDPYLAGQAAHSLSLIGKTAVPFLSTALQDQRENVRWGAAVSLSKIGKDAREAVPALISALNDKNSDIQWCSLLALGNIGSAASIAVPKILPFLSGRDEELKWAAVFALKKIEPGRLAVAPDIDSVKRIIERQLPTLMQEMKVPGVSVTLVKDGNVAWTKNFGIKDVRTQEPVSNETMFEACSMSKPVFAYVVMKLAEQKKIDLDTPLSKYLDEKFVTIGSYKNTITARMVLSHSSGLPNWRTGYEESDGPLPMYFKPGSRFGYSGEGMFYLQRVVEKITGEPLDIYAKRTLFDPLGLNHTSFSWNAKVDTLIAAGHDTSGAFRKRTQYVHPNAAYSLYSSAVDYAKFICTILVPGMNTSALSKTSIQEMRRRQIDVLVREPVQRPGRAKGISAHWGLGWGINSTISGDLLYHSGANQSGFRCYSQMNFADRTAIVIMTNSLNGSELWQRLISEIGDF